MSEDSSESGPKFNPDETWYGQYKSPYKPSLPERFRRFARNFFRVGRGRSSQRQGSTQAEGEPAREPFIDREPTRLIDLKQTRKEMEEAQARGELPTPEVSSPEKQN